MVAPDLYVCNKCGAYLDDHPIYGPYHTGYRVSLQGVLTMCLACGAVDDSSTMAHGCTECGRVDLLALLTDCPNQQNEYPIDTGPEPRPAPERKTPEAGSPMIFDLDEPDYPDTED